VTPKNYKTDDKAGVVLLDTKRSQGAKAYQCEYRANPVSNAI
tara:strand:+ start:61 stop:186 length:126 start_codon:yes stop_codon:yes gene_type:complete